MQALKSLFSRAQVQAAASVPAQQPVELSPESLKLVGGGLPRVSKTVDPTTSGTTLDASYELPRVS